MSRLSSLAALVLLLATAPPAWAQWKVTVKGTPIQKTEIINTMGYAVRIHVFREDDKVRAVPLKTGNRVLAADESWLVDSRGTAYRIDVFKSQAIDKPVARNLRLMGKTTLKSQGGKVVASTTADKTNASTTILNASKETIKVRIYNENDRINVVPKAVYTIKAGKKIEYVKPDTQRFRLTVFRATDLAFREPLTSVIARDRAQITIEPQSRLVWAFGDSLTAGVEAGGGAKGSYPAQLQDLLVNHMVVNKGQVGEVVSEEAADYYNMDQWGKRRLARELDKLAAARRKMPDLILLCQGANDRLAVMADNISNARSKEIEDSLKSDLEAMIRDAKKRGIQVILISQVSELKLRNGLPVSSGVPGFPPAYYVEIARKTGIPVDNETLGSIFRSPRRGEYLTDADDNHRHLSEKGAGVMAQKIADFLWAKKLLW